MTGSRIYSAARLYTVFEPDPMNAEKVEDMDMRLWRGVVVGMRWRP